MANRTCPVGMTAEQFDEAQRLYEVTESATAEERWRMCCLMAGKRDGELLGQTEFELRQHVLKMGAATLEAAVNQRRKKGTQEVALHVMADIMLASLAGVRRRSPASLVTSSCCWLTVTHADTPLS